MTNFVATGNNLQITLAAPHVLASGTVTLVAGYGAVIAARLAAVGAPTISANNPLKFTVIAASVITSSGTISDPTKLAIFTATTLTGDVLSGCLVSEGTVDQAFATGDTFAVLFSAGELVALQQTINGLESQHATLGDLVYGTGPGTVGTLGGNVATAPRFLSSAGNGSVSAAPNWSTIVLATVAGTPTGTPAVGAVFYDTTAHKLWVHDGGGVWLGVTLA